MSTLKEIAARTGLSVPTVARILRGDSKEVWPAMARRAARVRSVAKSCGYRPSAAARAMATGRFRSVALVMPPGGARSYVGEGLVQGLHDALARRGHHLIVSILDDVVLTDPDRVPRLLQERLADGLLMNYNEHIPAALAELIRRHRLPCVWLNVKQPEDAVYPDDRAATRTIAERLLELGHRRIAYADRSHPASRLAACHYSASDRLDGYRRALRQAGLPERVWMRDDPLWQGDAIDALTQVLASDDRPTAIVGYADTSVSAAVAASRLAGLRIPADLSVAAVADCGWDRQGLGLTMILQDWSGVAEAAVAMLCRKIEDDNRPQPSVAVPPCGERGHSLAPAPALGARATGATARNAAFHTHGGRRAAAPTNNNNTKERPE
jgi:LacI family transcriptional regulator